MGVRRSRLHGASSGAGRRRLQRGHGVASRPAVLMWCQEGAGQPSFPIDESAWLFDRGIVPMITWEPWQPPKVFGTVVDDQPRFSLKRIADGDWDHYIRKYAKEIKE